MHNFTENRLSRVVSNSEYFFGLRNEASCISTNILQLISSLGRRRISNALFYFATELFDNGSLILQMAE